MIQIIDSNESKRALVVVEEIFLERGDSEFIYKPMIYRKIGFYNRVIYINNLSKDVRHIKQEILIFVGFLSIPNQNTRNSCVNIVRLVRKIGEIQVRIRLNRCSSFNVINSLLDCIYFTKLKFIEWL